MSITKTLGGDRLGSGKKQKIHMHGFERSTHDLSYLWRSTMSTGTLVPFMSMVALPGDTFDIDLDCDIKTHPTLGPLFGSYKVQLDLFVAPIRLYQAFLHNNAINIGRNMANIKLPQVRLQALKTTTPEDLGDLDNSQINPSCLLSYLGIRGVGLNRESTGAATDRTFNAIPLLAYWEIYKNYYANKQEEIGAVIHCDNDTISTDIDQIDVINAFIDPPTDNTIPEDPATGSVALTTGYLISIQYTTTAPDPKDVMVNIIGVGWVNLAPMATDWTNIVVSTEVRGTYNGFYGNVNISGWRLRTAFDPVIVTPRVETFDLANIDTMRMEILKHSISQMVINDGGTAALTPYLWIHDAPNNIPNMLFSQEGLAIKTYQSDLLNNWISTEWIDGAGGINELTAIDTSGGDFQLPTLIMARKIYDMLNRVAVSDGTYKSWVEINYDHEMYQQCESPMYMGGLVKELGFQEVVSNSGSQEAGGNQPLGTLAGKGVMLKKHKGGHTVIKTDEHSYIIGLISLTPRIDYSQGNQWDTQLQTMDDFHKPMLDEIGFQDLITEQMVWWDTEYDQTNDVWVQKSAGKQPAWTNYMTETNKTRGNFAIASNEMFMTLNRRWEYEAGTIKDLTTYIDPVKYNFIFAQTSLDAQNFWAQISVDITARRKMSAKVMPNL